MIKNIKTIIKINIIHIMVVLIIVILAKMILILINKASTEQSY